MARATPPQTNQAMEEVLLGEDKEAKEQRAVQLVKLDKHSVAVAKADIQLTLAVAAEVAADIR